MPLTNDEMVKLSKAIFYAAGLHINHQMMLDKEVIFNLLNNYSDTKTKYSKKGNTAEIVFEINKE